MPTLYQLTLRHPAHTTRCVVGQFTAARKVQDVVLATGLLLEVYRPDAETGKLERIARHDTWAQVFGLAVYRMAGQAYDCLVVTSDSGKLAVLRMVDGAFEAVAHDVVTKTGVRRTAAGAYLAVDPLSRAVMVAAVERDRLVYTPAGAAPTAPMAALTAPAAAVGSARVVPFEAPLEAAAPRHLTLDVCALDTGFENPCFAALECDYGHYERRAYDAAAAPIALTYYELDQALHHVVRRRAAPVPPTALRLVALPHAAGGGVLVCVAGGVVYEGGGQRHAVALPRAAGAADAADAAVVCLVTHRLKDSFFILVQTRAGHLFKITVAQTPRVLSITYFDLIAPCHTLAVVRSGFLVANVANGDRLMYQFEGLGEEDETTVRVGVAPEAPEVPELSEAPENRPVPFTPRAHLRNLVLVDRVATLNPIVAAAVTPQKQIVLASAALPVEEEAAAGLDEEGPAAPEEATGPEAPGPASEDLRAGPASADPRDLRAGPASVDLRDLRAGSLKVLTHGLPTTLLVSSPLPFRPTAIFTTPIRAANRSHDYLVLTLTLSLQTVVLSIGEVVEEVHNLHFVATQPTLAVQQVGAASVVQVYAHGIRHVDTATGATTDWFPPAGIAVTLASCNRMQAVVALLNREVCYFEVDGEGQLVEYQLRAEMGAQVAAVAVAAGARAAHAVVACADATVSVVSLEPHNCLAVVSLQALSASASSMCVAGSSAGGGAEVHIGLETGLHILTHLDARGALHDTRTRFLGVRPVRLSAVDLGGVAAILAVSTRTWLGYHHQGQYKLTPIDLTIVGGAALHLEDIGGDAIVGVSEGGELVIFTVEERMEDFVVGLGAVAYVPRRMVVEGGVAYVVSAARSSVGAAGGASLADGGEATKLSGAGEASGASKDNKGDASKLNDGASADEASVASEVNDANEVNGTSEAGSLAGGARADHSEVGAGSAAGASDAGSAVVAWHSSLQAIPTATLAPTHTFAFPPGERALLVAKVVFGNTPCIVVGTTGAAHCLYTFTPALALVSRTEVDHPPHTLLAFRGQLLVGMAQYLRLYTLGQRQLLRKASTALAHFRHIVAATVQGGDRLCVADAAALVAFVQYDAAANCFVVFAHDTERRHCTLLARLDYDSVAGGDKFGNVFVLRVPAALSHRVDHDWNVVRHEPPFLNGAPARAHTECHYHVGDIVTLLSATSLNVGGTDALVYTGLAGSLGVLAPLATRREAALLTRLEALMREHLDYNLDLAAAGGGARHNLLGRDHLKWRGYYAPVRNVVDGDLVERFTALPPAAQVRISAKLDRTPRDLERKIAELRNRSAF